MKLCTISPGQPSINSTRMSAHSFYGLSLVRPQGRDALRLDVSLLYGVEVEHLRYPLGAVSPEAPHPAAIPIQENSLHLHMGAPGLQSDDAACLDFAAHEPQAILKKPHRSAGRSQVGGTVPAVKWDRLVLPESRKGAKPT
jgi:hypothetical protein